MAKTNKQKVSKKKPNAKNRTKYYKIVDATTQIIRSLKSKI